jgi:imidazolonepropionase-like amidohydrolase
MKGYALLLLLLFPIFFLCCNGSENPASTDGDAYRSIALTNCFLIDGTGTAPVSDAVVLIEEGRIRSVGTNSTLDVPSGFETVDLQGGYLLPGFMNTHVHSGYVASNLQEWARSGVTTVRDLGDLQHSPAESFSIRNELLKDNRHARLVAAGPLVTTVGGYGNYPVSSPVDATLKVNGLIDAGADLIKIAIEDNLQGRTWPMLSTDEIQMIVQTAHARGRPVSAHISRSKHLAMAIQADVDDLSHMAVDTVPDSLIAATVQNDIYWVPTLELWDGVADLHGVNWDLIAKNNLNRFVQAGGKVALGTDFDGYTTPFELGMPIHEMRLMQEAGMTSMQIIMAGTKHAAYVCDRIEDLGTIEPGKIADLLVVDGNPLEDLGILLNVQMVIHNGVIIRASAAASSR